MRDLAIEEGVEDQISLIPELANPKNLFGCIPVSAPVQSAAPVLQAA
jgi:ornithine cyclodeaminase